MRLSKNKAVTFKVNEVKYSLPKWSTIETLLIGKKVAFAVAPSFTTIADLLQEKKDNLNELIEGEDTNFIFTAFVSQLGDNFSNELFEDLHHKLFTGLRFSVKDEDGEYEDSIEIKNWSDHLDEYPENYEGLVWEAFKVNLLDFFMKQATVRSGIEKLKGLADPLMTKLSKSSKED